MNRLFLLLFAFFTLSLAAQEPRDSSNFRVAVYAGYYMPDDVTAGYYNGQDNNRLQSYINIPQIENQIRESLGGREFELAEYAQDMSYNNAASFELQAAYLFGKNWNISLRFHNVKLSSVSIFTLRVYRTNQPNQPTTDPYLEEADINGKETRSHIDLGVGKEWVYESGFFVAGEAGVDFNFIKVQQNQMRIAGQTYTLPLYTSQLNQQASPITTIGSGFYLTTGAGFKFQGSMDFSLKLTYMRTRINLNDVVEGNSNILIPAIGFTRLL